MKIFTYTPLRALRWFVFNAALMALAYMAVNGYTAAENLINFLLWLVLIALVVTVLFSSGKSSIDAYEKFKPGVPPVVDQLATFALALWFAAHGWLWTASGYIVELVLTISFVQDVEKYRLAQLAAPQN